MEEKYPNPQLPQNANTNNKEPDGSGAVAAGSPPLDAFDPTRLRLSQHFGIMAGVKKAVLVVPVRKPQSQEFIRVHPDEAYRIDTVILEVKEDRESYLVDPDLWEHLPEAVAKTLFTTINRQGVVFLWPVRLPNSDGRLDSWNQCAFDAARLARKTWLRLGANMSLGAYDIHVATANDLPEPDWPEDDFHTLLRIAFKNRFIQSLDHPVVRRLRGEV